MSTSKKRTRVSNPANDNKEQKRQVVCNIPRPLPLMVQELEILETYLGAIIAELAASANDNQRNYDSEGD